MVDGCLGKGVTSELVIPADRLGWLVALDAGAMHYPIADAAVVRFAADWAGMFGGYAVPVRTHDRIRDTSWAGNPPEE